MTFRLLLGATRHGAGQCGGTMTVSPVMGASQGAGVMSSKPSYPSFGARAALRGVAVVADSAGPSESDTALRCIHPDHRIWARNFHYTTRAANAGSEAAWSGWCRFAICPYRCVAVDEQSTNPENHCGRVRSRRGRPGKGVSFLVQPFHVKQGSARAPVPRGRGRPRRGSNRPLRPPSAIGTSRSTPARRSPRGTARCRPRQ